MQKVVIDSKVLMVSYFVSKKANELPQGSRNMDPITQNLAVAFNSNVCVKYIPFGISEEQLKKVFNFSAENNIILSIQMTTKANTTLEA